MREFHARCVKSTHLRAMGNLSAPSADRVPSNHGQASLSAGEGKRNSKTEDAGPHGRDFYPSFVTFVGFCSIPGCGKRI